MNVFCLSFWIDSYLSVDRQPCRKLYFTTCVFRVQVRDREIKVNIFDMAGHPFFYEVSAEMFTHLTYSFWILCNVRVLPSRGAVETGFLLKFCPPTPLSPVLTVVSRFSSSRCATSSTRTARVCCWCTTWACARASTPSTAGWAR